MVTGEKQERVTDGKSIASTGTGAKMHVWNAQTGDTQYVYSYSNPFLQFASIHTLAWSPDGTRFVASVAWSPDGTRLASASHDKTVHVWQVR